MLLTDGSSPVKLFEFEDISASNEHLLSNSDAANSTSDEYQSPNSLSNNMSG